MSIHSHASCSRKGQSATGLGLKYAKLAFLFLDLSEADSWNKLLQHSRTQGSGADGLALLPSGSTQKESSASADRVLTGKWVQVAAPWSLVAHWILLKSNAHKPLFIAAQLPFRCTPNSLFLKWSEL